MTKPNSIFLTATNLEKCGWLFSDDIGVMVREHECSGGKWDIEVDSYVPFASFTPGTTVWQPDPDTSSDSYENFETMIAANPTFKNYCWTHGDNVEFA